MRVAICDDDKNAIEYLSKKVEEIKIITMINKFNSIAEFRNAIDDGQRFDICFMDIDWEMDRNGIDFMSELNLIDTTMQVIYVTGYNDRFSQDIFVKKVNLCGFLVKPVDDKLLRSMVDNAVAVIRSMDTEKMIIHQNREVKSIPYKEIIYIESKAHHVLVHTLNEIITFYGSLENERNKLPNYFLNSHKSYAANMNYIKRIEKNKIYFSTGEIIDISKSRYAAVRQKYFEYIGEEM